MVDNINQFTRAALVERLRQAADRADYAADSDTASVCAEAAAEIERLTAEVARLTAAREAEIIQAQADAAHREWLEAQDDA